MSKKQIAVILSIAATVVFWQCEGPIGPAGDSAAYVTLAPTTASIDVGATATFVATTTGQSESETYTWTSSNTDVATVSDGVVTAVAPGLAMISATGSASAGAAFAAISVTAVDVVVTAISFADHILPLFTTDEVWGPGTEKCTACHAGEGPYSHELDMGTHAGIIAGADAGDEPILGNAVGGTDYDWGSSGLRRRLRNTRMPPNFPFVMDMSNRDGPDLEVVGGHYKPIRPFVYTKATTVDFVHLMEAWVNSLPITATPTSADSVTTFSFDGVSGLTFADDILPFFTEASMWFEASEACVSCHFDNSDVSSHELDTGSYYGILLGADAGDEAIITPGDWSTSPLRKRFRNNRMPPNVPFYFGQSNRKGPILTHPVTGVEIRAVDFIGEWVAAGAPNN